MANGHRNLSRRAFLAALAASGGAFGTALPLRGAWPAPLVPPPRDAILTKPIPATGEALPVIGMGSWITFAVGSNRAARAVRVEVLRAFFEGGGGLIDSSPMYGSSEEVIGHCLENLDNTSGLFSATKVWTPLQWYGVNQINTSRDLWGVERFDLLQIHNLLAWEKHLETLLEAKAQGRVRYIGVTTSHGRRHDLLEQIMAKQPIDFVQFTYNIEDREAEQRLLPLAAERGLAVIANRPFRRGDLIVHYQDHPLPPWADEIDCVNWPQFFLKFIVSHPAVTCAIPATSRVDHMHENMGAARGRLPDPDLRARMAQYVDNL